MKPTITRVFLYSAGTILFTTAVAKLISSFGNAGFLLKADPILGVSFKHLFWIAGVIELAVAMFCFVGKRPVLQAGLVAWLASSFVIYRFGLFWIDYHRPCSCLGNLTDALHIPPQTADTIMKIVLGYLLFGSHAVLFRLWKQPRKTQLRSGAAETAPATG